MAKERTGCAVAWPLICQVDITDHAAYSGAWRYLRYPFACIAVANTQIAIDAKVWGDSVANKAIIITGSVGSGKTTTMGALTELLEDRNISCAGIDMDYLRWFHPHAPGDRFGTSVGLKHLSLLAESYCELGIPLLILADVIEDSVAAHQLALPDYDVTVVRLHVPVEEMHARLRQRESPQRVAWYLDRAIELQTIQDENEIGDVQIQVGDQSPEQVAREIDLLLGLSSGRVAMTSQVKG